MTSERRHLTFAFVLAALAGCGGSDNKECNAGDACANGAFCESFVDGSGMHNACFAPTVLAGKVSDAISHAAIAGARVVAIDGDSHAAVGPVSITDVMGNYTVRVTAPRMSGADKQFTLRVGAAGYQEFPGGIRIALPITVTFPDPKGTATVDGPQNVELMPLSPASAGSIAGKVGGTLSAGVLVVASNTSGAYSTVSDASGDYVLFNIPDGTFSVQGYFVGVNFTPVDNVVVAGARKDGVNLMTSGVATASLTGTLSYVAGADTSLTTAVVLRLQSTHEVPPGLQVAAQNATPYQMAGVPDGTYEVLASFPTDMLVKDPDPGQAGTAIPVVTFAGNTVDAGTFKITDPVNIIGPDANEKLTGMPTFTWTAYPQTDHYKIDVFDAQGDPIWSQDNIPRSESLAYGGPALTAGGYYQWRITSFAVAGGATTSRPISQSEDLRGVWQQM
jgi:hypothetical protein